MLGPIAVYVIVAIMFGLLGAWRSCRCHPCKPDHEVARATDRRGRARCASCSASWGRASAFVRANRRIAWSLTYLGIAASLIGVLGAIGPGFATDILGLRPRGLLLHHGPGRPRAQWSGSSSSTRTARAIPKRLVIDIGLIAMGLTLDRARAGPAGHLALRTAPRPRSRRPCPSIAPLVSLIAVVVVIAVFAGLEYAFVAIPSQTALQEELPTEVRGRIFGILNTLLSVASFLPVILAPAAADILNIFFPGPASRS